MGFAAGKLERMIQGRKGKFNGYDIAGDWLVDVNGKQGWLVQLVGFGSFSEMCIRDSLEAGRHPACLSLQ